MPYEPQSKWSFLRFAVRHSYREALALTLLLFVPLLLFGRIVTSAFETAAIFLGFYLVSVSLLVLYWYADLGKRRREARKKGQ